MGRGAPRIAAALALLLLLAIGVRAHADRDAPSLAEPPRAAAAAAGPEVASQALDRNLMVLRAWLAGAALGVLVWGALPGRSRRWIRTRRTALGLLAALSFGANYNFFLSTEIHKHEFFHYYLGAKYAPELGYYEIYRCSIAADFEQRFEHADPLFQVTDLRSNEVRMFWSVAPRSPRCDGTFSPPRWEEFKHDLAGFREILGPHWRRVLLDHGYNPTPIWTLIGRPLTWLFPVETGSLWILARLDLALILILLAAIGWAFGFESACIAAIAWGANPHTRYQWIGDAFLRNAWLSASMLGLCLLRKQMFRGAGALLTLSSLLRIFPALLVVGYVLRQLRLWLRGGSLDPGFRLFLVSASITALVLGIAGSAVAGRGPGVYLEFSKRIAALSAFVPDNALGLRPLLSRPLQKPEPERIDGVWTIRMETVQRLRRDALAKRRPLYFGAMAVFLALFWRASSAVQDWEAAAMGAALILVLTAPASYYLSFVLAAALLATRRPRIGIELMLTLLGWNLALLLYPGGAKGYRISSAIGLVFFLIVLLEMQRTPAARPAEV